MLYQNIFIILQGKREKRQLFKSFSPPSAQVLNTYKERFYI